MNVYDIMTKDIETVTADESLFDAARKMKNSDAGAIPVTTAEGDVAGILTDRDLVMPAAAEGADPKEVRVGEVITTAPISCRPDCPLEAAAETMRDKQIRRLLVTQEHNKNVVGIVSLGDIAARAHQKELAGASTEGCQPS